MGIDKKEILIKSLVDIGAHHAAVAVQYADTMKRIKDAQELQASKDSATVEPSMGHN